MKGLDLTKPLPWLDPDEEISSEFWALRLAIGNIKFLLGSKPEEHEYFCKQVLTLVGFEMEKEEKLSGTLDPDTITAGKTKTVEGKLWIF